MHTNLARKAFILFAFLLSSFLVFAQSSSLPRSTPEAEGVSSAGITGFLNAYTSSRCELHGFMILRHGKVIAEGWSSPYAPDLKHTMYSVSKSFASTAVGFAIAEKKMKLTDKVISFFPDQAPQNPGALLSALTVRDLLMMSAGQKTDPTRTIMPSDNWIKEFLQTPIVDTPGKKFLYNSMATFMLSAIAQKVTGEKIFDYLKPRLFSPLGITDVDWEENPQGINSGGWGLRLRVEDMAKFGQTLLQKGVWNGKQIIPKDWIAQATSKQIDQQPNATAEVRRTNDWAQGYGYQFWRCRNNAFRADGAFGQLIVVIPEKDAVVIVTEETAFINEALNMIWDHLLPSMGSSKLAANKAANDQLKTKSASLQLGNIGRAADSSHTHTLAEKQFRFQPNSQNVESVSFHDNDTAIAVSLDKNKQQYDFIFGKDKWIKGSTEKWGPLLTTLAKDYTKTLSKPKVAGYYRWKDDATLELNLQYIESPHKEIWTCRFFDDKVSIAINNSIAVSNSSGQPESVLVGTAE